MRAPSEPLESPLSRSPSDLPPLRLTHLLLYVAVWSAYLSFATLPQIQERVNSTMPAPGYHQRLRIELTLMGLVQSATITVVILLLVWWMQGRRVWDQPGHWIAASTFWGAIGHECCHQLVMLFKWLTGSESTDDFIQFWAWAKGFYALEALPFALVFIWLAIRWRGVSSTWLWRLYFASAAVWLLIGSLHHLPFDWSASVMLAIPAAVYRTAFWWGWRMTAILALVAIANDALPGRPSRHWSHWVPACNLLLIELVRYLPRLVWQLFY